MYSLSNDLLIHLHCSVVRQRPVPIASVLVSDPLIFAENFFLVEISLSLFFHFFYSFLTFGYSKKERAKTYTHPRSANQSRAFSAHFLSLERGARFENE